MVDEDDIFKGLGVEIKIGEKEDFLKIKETLTRMGVASKNSNKLFQSCSILHRRGRYAIMHFKEMFALDGKPTNFSDEDKGRRNLIVKLLQEWNLIRVVEPEQIKKPLVPMSMLKVISHKEKDSWISVQKYTVGASKNDRNKVDK